MSPVAADVLRLLADEARGADEIVAASGRASSEVGVALVELELAGLAACGEGVWRAVG